MYVTSSEILLFNLFTLENVKLSQFQPDGDKVHLDDYNGIDMLGNMMESSTVSIDRNYYGDIHNMGHVFMAFAHDPEHRHLESFGVLGNFLNEQIDQIVDTDEFF